MYIGHRQVQDVLMHVYTGMHRLKDSYVLGGSLSAEHLVR
jgi:hypothetical protein